MIAKHTNPIKRSGIPTVMYSIYRYKYHRYRHHDVQTKKRPINHKMLLSLFVVVEIPIALLLSFPFVESTDLPLL